MPESPPRLERLTLVRHGETRGQSSIRYWGSTDIELSELGEAQMQRVGEALRGETFDAVLTSTKERTTRAAEIIVPQLTSTPVVGFNEISFGAWEGLTREEIARVDPQGYQVWRDAPHEWTYPGAGDSVACFRERVLSVFRWLLPELPPRTLMIVHRGIIGAVLTELLGLSEEERAAYPIDLGSIHVLTVRDGAWCAEQVNATTHLEDLRLE